MVDAAFTMAARSLLLLFVLTTTCLVEVFQFHPGQERLSHDELQDPGSLGNASFDRFVNEIMHEYHVPGLSLAVIDSGQISTAVLLVCFNMTTHFAEGVVGLWRRKISKHSSYT
jgi:CubicO group peptidase (beta-lactamase class C family)